MPFTVKILLFDRTLPSPKNPPNVATNPKIIIPTIIEDPEEVNPFLILDNADIIFLKKTRHERRVFYSKEIYRLSLRALPGLNPTPLEAAIWIEAPV